MKITASLWALPVLKLWFWYMHSLKCFENGWLNVLCKRCVLLSLSWLFWEIFLDICFLGLYPNRTGCWFILVDLEFLLFMRRTLCTRTSATSWQIHLDFCLLLFHCEKIQLWLLCHVSCNHWILLGSVCFGRQVPQC